MVRNIVQAYFYKAIFYRSLFKNVTCEAVDHSLAAEVADYSAAVGEQLVAYDRLVYDTDVFGSSAYNALCIV